jgi:uncharacterized membrane protein SpoIIM required for sporulation
MRAMKETKFIQQNKAKWKEFEQVMEGRYSSPEKMHDLFIQITDDLSYSRTYYPNRSVRVYLNSLAQRIFFSIYRNRRSRVGRFFRFWTDELPKLVFESRRDFLLAFVVFVVSLLIGAFSSAMDSEFATLILGEEYVQQTLRNIDAGDPMAIYKGSGEFGMFLGITINNLWVAFLTFVLGATYIGTLGILIRNGIMIGVFQYFFISRGLFWESFLTIWIHGTLEISAIVMAGGAGLTMGRGLVFPGTYRRLQAFQQSARRGIKIMLGLAPFIILAGFFEGYLTRHTETPDFIRGLFIVACLAFVLIYFVWYPRLKARIGFDTEDHDGRVPPDQPQNVNFKIPKTAGIIFADIFVLFRKYGWRIFQVSLGATAFFATAVFLLSPIAPAALFQYPYDFFASMYNVGQFFYDPEVWVVTLVGWLMLSMLFYGVQRQVLLESVGKAPHSWSAFFRVALGTAVLLLVFLSNIWVDVRNSWFWYNVGLILFVVPALLLWIVGLQQPDKGVFKSLSHAIALVRQKYSQSLILMLILFFLGFLFISISDSIILWFFLDMISWVVYVEGPLLEQFSAVVLTVVSVFILNMVLSLFMLGGGILYYSLLEIETASNLREKIQQVGFAKTIQGIQQESGR